MTGPWPRVAWRGIRRHPRRSVLVVLAMAAGLFVLIFLKGLQDGFVDQRLEQGLGMMVGHAVVEPATAASGGASRELQRELHDAELIQERLAEEPAVIASSARVRGQALARTDGGSAGVVVLGVDGAAEAAATQLPAQLVEGVFLPEKQPGRLPPAALGVGLAARLGVGLGDRLALLAEGHDGSLFAESYVVAGLFESGGQLLDGGFVYLRRRDARRLLAVEGAATELVLRLADPREAPAVAARLAARLGARTGSGAAAGEPSAGEPSAAPLVVRSWHETAPELLSAMEMLRVMERLRNLVLFVLVGLGILNAVVMSVFERRREFGIWLALGLRPSAVLRLLLWEVGWLALAGILLGVGSAWIVTDLWLGQQGLDVFALGARLPGALEGSSVVYPVVRWGNVLTASAWVGALALLVLVWPARALLRLDPAEVLRSRA